jgi:type II secretory pathway component PulF
LYRKNKDNYGFRKVVDNMKLNFPVLHTLFLKRSLIKFLDSITQLLRSGVRLDRSVEIAGRTAGNVIVTDACLDVAQQVKEGKELTYAIKQHPKVFEPMIVGMVGAGQVTGKFWEMFATITNFYKKEVKLLIENLEKLIEPIVLVFVSVILLIVALAIYLPVFQAGGLMG